MVTNAYLVDLPDFHCQLTKIMFFVIIAVIITMLIVIAMTIINMTMFTMNFINMTMFIVIAIICFMPVLFAVESASTPQIGIDRSVPNETRYGLQHVILFVE